MKKDWHYAGPFGKALIPKFGPCRYIEFCRVTLVFSYQYQYRGGCLMVDLIAKLGLLIPTLLCEGNDVTVVDHAR